MTTTVREFFSKLGQFFPIFEKGQGKPPTLPPSSYAPEEMQQIAVRKDFIMDYASLILTLITCVIASTNNLGPLTN